jgi:hypothetical protein
MAMIVSLNKIRGYMGLPKLDAKSYKSYLSPAVADDDILKLMVA